MSEAPTRAPAPRTLRGSTLFLDRAADVFDRLADFPSRPADGVLRRAGRFIADAFVVQRRIVREITGRLLDLAFEGFGLSFELVAIHDRLLPRLPWLV